MTTNTTKTNISTAVKPQWYALRVQPGMESYTAKSLLRRGIPGLVNVVVPTEKLRKHSRSGQKVVTEKVIFPGYAFVLAELQDDSGAINVITWERILAVQGVRGFAGETSHTRTGETIMTITPMREEEVEAVQEYSRQSSEAGGRVVNGLQVNDPIKVTEGPFQGQTGVVKSVDNTTGKAEVVLQVFGRETTVSADLGILEKNL